MKYILLFVAVIVALWACKKDKAIFEPTPYELEIPSHFPAMNIPADNPMTVEGIELGRKLFYDTRLSLDNSIACSSCHEQQYAFTDPKQFSLGVGDSVGTRNSMALVNLGWQQFFFWDGRAKTLEDQILGPVPNPVEMHLEWPQAVKKVAESEEYRNEFFRVFGAREITKELVAKAIAQFLRTLISGTSKYDVMYKHENGLALTSKEQMIWEAVTNEEKAGYDLKNR